MTVDSYLELFVTMYGWGFAAIIRDVLIATGVIYLPFILLVAETWMEGHQSTSAEGGDAAWMVRKMEIELGCAIFVLTMCFTTTSMLTVSQISLSYTPEPTKLVPAPATATGGSSGTTFGPAFTSVPGTVEVPAWWYTVMGLSSGINQAVKAGIGNNMDGFRQLEEMARISSFSDPIVRAELQRFGNECWLPTRSKYYTMTGPLSAAGAAALAKYGETDPEWIGSHVFQVEPGLYDTKAADSEVPGFAVSATQDADVAGSAVPPAFGRPTCAQWWPALAAKTAGALLVAANGTIGGQPTLASLVPALISAPAGDIDDAILRMAISRSRPTIVDTESIIGDSRSWYQKMFAAPLDLAGISGSVGQNMDAMASKFPMVQFMTMAQPMILMAIYMFIPLIVVVSRYSLSVMFVGGLAIFTVKFWPVMWFIARLMDDHLIKAMYPNAATLLGQFMQDGADGVVKRLSLNTMLVGLYLGLPMVWSGMMAWAGFNFGKGIMQMKEQAIGAGIAAGKSGSIPGLNQIGGAVKSGLSKGLSGK